MGSPLSSPGDCQARDLYKRFASTQHGVQLTTITCTVWS